MAADVFPSTLRRLETHVWAAVRALPDRPLSPPKKAATTCRRHYVRLHHKCTHQTGRNMLEIKGAEEEGRGGWRVQVDGGRPGRCTCLIRLFEVEAIRLVHAPLPLANRSAPLRRLPARTRSYRRLALKDRPPTHNCPAGLLKPSSSSNHGERFKC